MFGTLLSLPDTASRLYRTLYPPRPAKKGNALRLGILGAARIAPIAVINPALSHPDLVVAGVAARDVGRAKQYAKKWGIGRVYGSYDELIQSAEIDVVYNPLPNGLHHEWTLKCIEAGKHVLLEKPSASNEREAREIFERAREKNVLVLEAFHYRFHPALHEFAYQLYEVMSGINPLLEVEAELAFGFNPMAEDDIRFNYALAGGILMDMGCYPVSAALYACRACAGTENRLGWEKMIAVQSAQAELFTPANAELREKSKPHCDPNTSKPAVDRAMRTTFTVPTAGRHVVTCTVKTSMGLYAQLPSFLPRSLPLWGEVKIPTALWPQMRVRGTFKDGSRVTLDGFAAPSLWHRITLECNGERTVEKLGMKLGQKRVVTAYTPNERRGEEQAEQQKRAAKDGFWQKGKGEPYCESLKPSCRQSPFAFGYKSRLNANHSRR